MTARVSALVPDHVGVVRSLGDVGIRSVVLSEYPHCPTFRSRHCAKGIHVPDLSGSSDRLLETFLRIGEAMVERPPILLGRESLVNFVSSRREALGRSFRIKMAPPEIMAALADKCLFAEFAVRHGLEIPRTWVLRGEGDLVAAAKEVTFPCLLKPPAPEFWANDAVYAILGRWTKAAIVRSAEELETLARKLFPLTPGMVAQEFVPGGDDALFDLHAYCAEPGKIAGYFLGRKIRVQPIHFGRGSYTRSWSDDSVARVGLEALEAIGYVGPANFNLKRDERTGRTSILEINPRFSLWCHLASRCGVNLPHAFYNDCLGLPLPTLRQDRRERRWLFFSLDWLAFRQYAKAGELSAAAWIRSLVYRPILFFRWDWRDPLPALRAAWNFVALRLGARFRALFGRR